jgi:hypothetical protein
MSKKLKSKTPSDAAACSLPKYLKSCKPPFFSVGSQIFGKYPPHGDSLALEVRGWGRLTNSSSKLTEGEACVIQDEFAAWVCKAMNTAAENADAMARRRSDG